MPEGLEGTIQVPEQTIQMELETLSIIEVVMNQLEGKVYDHKIKGYKQVGKPIINEEGAKTIATELAAYLSRDKFLTDVSHQDVRDMTKEATESFITLLMMNYKKYGIEKPHLGIILRMIEHTIYINLSRGKEGRTLDHIGGLQRQAAEKQEGWKLPHISMPFGGGGTTVKVEGQQ